MGHIVKFTDQGSDDKARVGGKGANLGRLATAGFPVPPGFTLTTEAYADFMRATGLDEFVAKTLAALDFANVEQLEAATAGIRERIITADMPQGTASEVRSAYSDLGEDVYVAVRSSGTAEDLAEASFAGLHDTYLDVNGTEDVIDAVKRCWASLWTARATSYRDARGFDQSEALLAVVVQQMISAEISGVMFTANPISGAVDEIVINASWGLGEGIVSGILTPDQYIVGREKLDVWERTLGSKEARVVRNPETGKGTVTLPGINQNTFTLSDSQAAKLAQLGRGVTTYYDEFPQDTEWAYADGEFYLLQSRDVTGVELSWDEDLEDWQTLEHQPDWIWTRGYADEFWTGAITPLHYSFRAREFSLVHEESMRIFGFDDLSKMRIWKYHKGEAYFSGDTEKLFVQYILPKFLRTHSVLHKVPPSWWDETINAPFSLSKYIKIYARVRGLAPTLGPVKWIDTIYDYKEHRRDDAEGASNEQLRGFTDLQLQKFLYKQIDHARETLLHMWGGFFIYAPGSLTLMADLLQRWAGYSADEVGWVFAELCAGLPKQTTTLVENHELWVLAQELNKSEKLVELTKTTKGAEFFRSLEDSDEGRAFLAKYNVFLKKYAHRGAADRDVWFTRRGDDPMIDYNALTALMNADQDPAAMEAQLIAKREKLEAEVAERIRNSPLGFAKAEIFRIVHWYALKFLVIRDDEREYLDQITYSQRRGFLEVARRLLDRGLIEKETDVFFLSVEELFEVLNNTHNPRLVRAKIDGRERNFRRFDTKEVMPPPFIQRGMPALPGQEIATPLDESAEETPEGVFRGMGTSRGKVTARARIVRSLEEIHTVQKGEILICNSTDPGWTPVFLVISGLVLEAGGMLSHGACLSREYGFPAVQITNAIGLIPDGALITINGDTGEVRVEEDIDAEIDVTERDVEPELAGA